MHVVITISLRKLFVRTTEDSLHQKHTVLENYSKKCQMRRTIHICMDVKVLTMFPSLLILSLFSFLHFRKKPIDNARVRKEDYQSKVSAHLCSLFCACVFRAKIFDWRWRCA